MFIFTRIIWATEFLMIIHKLTKWILCYWYENTNTYGDLFITKWLIDVYVTYSTSYHCCQLGESFHFLNINIKSTLVNKYEIFKILLVYWISLFCQNFLFNNTLCFLKYNCLFLLENNLVDKTHFTFNWN